MELEITLRVNGAAHRLSVDTRTTLLDALRERLGNAFKVPLARHILVRTLLDLAAKEGQG
jgi:hypothetical protein